MATRSAMPRINRRGRYVLGLLVAVIALLTVGGWLISLYTKYLWYDSVGYTGVFSTMAWTRVWMFVIIGGVLGLWTAANLYVAYRFRPDSVPHTPEQQSMERYRSTVTHRIGWWVGGLGGLVAIFAGISAQENWQKWLLFANSTDFGRKDPQFKIDVGFYVFELPFYQYLVGIGFTMIVIGIVAALGAHYLYGAVRLSGRGERITPAARWHLSVLIGTFVLLKAVAYFLDRFALTTEHNDVTNLTGGGYTEMTALLPAKEILIFVAVLAAVAVVVFSNFYARSLLVPGMALGLVLVSAIAIGGIYPYAVKSITVSPNVPDKESKYVQNTIDGTMYAYGMEDMVRTSIEVNGNADPNQLSDDTGTMPHVRMMDPSIVSDAFTQKQQARGFHDFNEKLDVDMYTDADGNKQDYVVGVRELNPDKFNSSQEDWTVRHTIFTHGYGLVAAPTDRVCDAGPYFESGSLLDLDDAGDGEEGSGDGGEGGDSANGCRSDKDFVDIDRPQVYYGELNDDYAIVGVPDGGKPREYDHPSGGITTEDQEGSGDEVDKGGDTYVNYEGEGGVDVSSFGRRLAYAWEFGEMKFLLSDQFNDNSQLLYNRTPRERVQDVAPFLTIDGDPYPTVVDGKIKWVLDGYTTTDSFPYSNTLDLQDASSDSYTNAGATQQDSQPVNYMRNSVKATVDAYDGSVELYQFGEADPLLDVWNEAFGGIVKPQSEIPEDLAAHLRYPVDQFKVQRDLLQRFHVENARTFIDGSDVWQAPADPTREDATLPPYYVLATYPDQDDPQFQLTSNFAPKARDNALAAMLTGRYDSDNKPVLTLYSTTGGQVESTGQMHQDITTNDVVAADLKNYEQQKVQVQWGNLLSLPIGNGVLYVEPMYIQKQASGEGTALPLLRKVAVSYGGNIGYGDTFALAVQDAIDQYTANAGDDNAGDDSGDDSGGGDSGGGDAGEVPQDVQDALDQIDAAVADLNQAMEDGDLAAQGKALEALDAALKAYDEAKAAHD